jgi:hypothetical protein
LAGERERVPDVPEVGRRFDVRSLTSVEAEHRDSGDVASCDQEGAGGDECDDVADHEQPARGRCQHVVGGVSNECGARADRGVAAD